MEGSPDGGQRGVVADPDGFAVAGSSGGLRVLEDGLQPASAVVCRRHLGGAAGVAAWLRRRRRELGVGIDSTVVRAHQHAAGAPHRPPADVPPNGSRLRWLDLTAAVTAAQGRRGGLNRTDTVAAEPIPISYCTGETVRSGSAGPLPWRAVDQGPPAADSRCRPLGVLTTAGQRHDSVAFELTLPSRAATDRPGRPRTRPDALLADKAYSNQAIRGHLANRGIKAVIPIKDDQPAPGRRKGTRGGRPPPSTQTPTASATRSSEP